MKVHVSPFTNQTLPLGKQVYELLHQQIVTFELKPFQMLSEASVSDSLGVSRTPAREALARLAEKNFVDVLPQRGSQVAPLRISDLEKSQFMREALEIALLRRVMEKPDDQRAALVHNLRREIKLQTTYVEIDDREKLYASDEAFHGLIAEYAGLADVLPDILRGKGHMDRFRHLMMSGVEDMNVVIVQHTVIVDAIEGGDVAQATHQMRTHLRRIFDFVGEARRKFPDYFEAPSEGVIK